MLLFEEAKKPTMKIETLALLLSQFVGFSYQLLTGR